MIGNLPDPCPVLKQGLALGAPQHEGFAAVWNWIVDLFRSPKDNFVVGVNNRTGKINIVAGKGVDVITKGETITIGLGGGKSTDKDNLDDNDPNGGGAQDNEGIWQNAKPEETSGGSVGGGGGMFPWDASTAAIGAGGCMVGRKWYTASTGLGSGKGDGLYQLKVTIDGSGNVTLEVVSESTLGKAPTTTECWIPIYQITNGQVATDYRGAFVVPAFD